MFYYDFYKECLNISLSKTGHPSQQDAIAEQSQVEVLP